MTTDLQKAIDQATVAGAMLLRKSQMSLFDTHPEKHERHDATRHLASGAVVQVHNTSATVHVADHSAHTALPVGEPQEVVMNVPKNPKTGPQRVAVLRTMHDPKVQEFLQALDAITDRKVLWRQRDKIHDLLPENYREQKIGGEDLYWVYLSAIDLKERELRAAVKAEAVAYRQGKQAEKEKVTRERAEQVERFRGANPELQAAIEQHKPELEAAFKQGIASNLAYLVSKHGPKLQGMGASQLYSNIRFMLRREADDTVVLREDEVQKQATKYADNVAMEWFNKISGKMTEMQSATVSRLDDRSFAISGTVNGHAVTITQGMIINRSTYGNPFNQFPARIYVDGNFMSEAAYKKVMAQSLHGDGRQITRAVRYSGPHRD